MLTLASCSLFVAPANETMLFLRLGIARFGETGHASLVRLAMPALVRLDASFGETGHASFGETGHASLVRLAMPALIW